MTTVAINDALETVANAFDFHIEKQKVALGPDCIPTDGYGLVRCNQDGSREHVGRFCSKNYMPHTTDDVLALTEAACNVVDGDVKVRTHFEHGHYVDITPSDQYRIAVYKGRDSLFPRFMINGSYNGRGFSASLGYYRDLCRNLAMMRKTNKASHVSIAHTSHLRSRMDDLIDTFSTLKEEWQTMSTLIAQLTEIPLNVEQFMREVYPQPENNSTKYENKIEKVLNRLASESHRLGQPDPLQTRKSSAWLLWNAVQGYEQHNSIRSKSITDFGRVIKAENPFTRKAESMVAELIA